MKKTICRVLAFLLLTCLPAGYAVCEQAAENPPSEDPARGFFDVTDEEPYFVYSGEGRHYGYEEDYTEGCSVWCAVTEYRVRAEASSALGFHEAQNIISGERGNAWIASTDEAGEYIEITRRYEVSDAEYGVDFNELCVVNGYAASPGDRTAYSRVSELKLYVDGIYAGTFTLEDTAEPQYFSLKEYNLHAASGADSVWRFEIDSVYPGDTCQNAALTGIEIAFWTPNH